MTQQPTASASDILQLIPADWLSQKQDEYLTLTEKITFTLIQVAAAQAKWKGPLKSPSDYEALFAAEAARLQKTVSEIKALFHQAASIKAKEQVFEKHFGSLIPRDAAGNPVIPKADLARFVRASNL